MCTSVLLIERLIIGQEFQAVFLSTTEPVDAHGNTTNPTKSPCDRYVFNTVLTRARSLVVVVGSPLILLKTEAHMVKLYGNKGKCWSVYLKKCLEKNTFIIPSSVGESEYQRQQFKAKLASGLGVKSPSLVSHPSSGNSVGAQPVKQPAMRSPKPKSPPKAQQRQKRSSDIATDMNSLSGKAAQPSSRYDTSTKNITSPSCSKPVPSKHVSKPHTPILQTDKKPPTVRSSPVGHSHRGINPQVNRTVTSKRQLPAVAESPREKNSPKTKSKDIPVQNQRISPNNSMYLIIFKIDHDRY